MRTRAAIQSLAITGAVIGALLVAVPIMTLTGPVVESYFLPVVDDVRVLSTTRDGDAVEFDVAGEKVRQCDFLGASAIAGPRHGLMQAARLSFPDAVPGSATRPVGLQSFGIWRVEPVRDGEQVEILVRHDCHFLWGTSTRLGPWPVGAAR